MDQYIGKLLDNRYEILERIGTGGMAVVYKARCHRLNRLVAVKILKEELAQDAEFRRRFHDESQAVAMLSHPNIVAVYDVSRSAEIDYIVMELIDGITLKQYIQKKGEGKLSWREALHFITQIMKALSHAHSRGIIHRDIKPHNIMVLRDGSVKVADFGIARLASAAQVTLTQEALGSVHYISPEQARGSHIDARSDIYSAGVVLYEMITGRLPYEGDSPVSVAIQHINSIPLSPREIDPEIPEALEAITKKAMASNVDHRYLSADTMLADLEEFRKNPNINFEYTQEDLRIGEGDEPTQVLGANTPHSVRMQPSRDAVPASQRKRSHPRRDYDEDDDYDRRDGSRLPLVLAICAIVIFLVGIGVFLYVSFFSDIFGTNKGYRVPDLHGLTIEEATQQQEVKDYEFEIVKGETVASTLPEGQIVSQNPESGMNADRGAIITVSISDGSESIPDVEEETMPDLQNLDRRLAISRLESLGISKDKIELTEENSDVTVDYIISQKPEKGASLAEVEKVTLVVSLGPKEESVTVIPFVGLTKDQAKQQAEALNLKVNFTEEYDATAEVGKVFYQSIPSASSVPAGTTLTLKISKGPEPAEENPGGDEPSNPDNPSPSPAPSPVQSPSTGQTPVIRNIQVALPDDGRETVKVEVSVGGSVQRSYASVETRLGTINVPIKGNGTQTVIIYIDDTAADTYQYDFGS